MARFSTMPTIPDANAMQDDEATGWPVDNTELDPESDFRCKSVQTARADLDDEAAETARYVLGGVLPANRDLFLSELMRFPPVLSEHTTLGTAAELFARGMEGPVVLVTDENKPIGMLTPTHVLRMIKERSIEEVARTTMIDVVTPFGVALLEENASLLEAAERFVAKDCDVLVVVKRDGQLAGVLLARDLCLLWV